MTPTWDILIATIPHRYDRLCELLAELDRQMVPGAGARVYSSLAATAGGPQFGEKILHLAQSSQARWISKLDDDDWVAPDFIPRVMAALETGPDYVGFPVHYAIDGGAGVLIDHSLDYPEWIGETARDISDLNPIRRSIALQGDFLGSREGDPAGGFGSDRAWADSIRRLGLVKTQVYISEPMYYYRYSRSDNYLTVRDSMPPREPPPYSWLTLT